MSTLLSCTGPNNYEEIDKYDRNISLKQLQAVKVTHGPLTEVSLYTGGGMLGDSDSDRIVTDSGELYYIKESSPQHNIPLRGYQYRLKDAEALTKLREVIDRYNLSVWDKLPFDDENIALDAPSSSISMVFDDTETGGRGRASSRISYDNVIPDGGYDVLKEFKDMFSAVIREKELTETYLVYDGEKLYSGREIANADEEAELFLSGYWRSVRMEVYRDGAEPEITEYTGDSCYNFDYSPGWGELELRAYQLEDDNRSYTFKEIVHEPIADCDSSWHAVFQSGEEDPEEVRVTIDKDMVYMERTEAGTRTVLLFERY